MYGHTTDTLLQTPAVFTIDDSVAKLATTTEADDLLNLPAPPAWVESVLWEVDVLEVNA